MRNNRQQVGQSRTVRGEEMKKIILRDTATGKIIWDKDYGKWLSVFGSEQKLDDEIERRNRLGQPFEIAELDDIAEYYAKKAESAITLDDMEKIEAQLTDTVNLVRYFIKRWRINNESDIDEYKA